MKVLPQQPPDKQNGKTVTYSQLLDAWLRSSRLNIKESTYARYAHLIGRHIKPHLGDLLLSQLTTQAVENYIAAQLESGIEKANFHATRHTFATRCVEVGFEIKSLSEILGHANANITLNRYVPSSFELKCSNMNKLTLNL